MNCSACIRRCMAPGGLVERSSMANENHHHPLGVVKEAVILVGERDFFMEYCHLYFHDISISMI